MAGKTQPRSLGEDPLVRLVDSIYAGAVEPRAWLGIVAAVAEYIGAPMGRLFTPSVERERGGLDISYGIPEPALRQWAARYVGHDVWAQAGIAKELLHEGSVVLDADLVPEHQFVQSVIYREHLRNFRIGRLCSGIVFDQRSPAVPPTQFSAYRDLKAKPFGERERRRMQLLIPHLSRALGVMYRLHDAELKMTASLAALDQLACGVLVVDRTGRVSHANREAQRILKRGDGLLLRQDAGSAAARLAAHEPAAQAQLRRALASVLDPQLLAASHFSCSVDVARRDGALPLLLQLAPLPQDSGFLLEAGPAAAIVFVTDPDRPNRLDSSLLQRLYAVTPAEARLAAQLIAGETLATAAAHCGIGEPTARTQLRSLFEKTGTHRQADLMRLMVSLASSAA